MFPRPIQQASPAAQTAYKTMLPIALILWLLPLIAVAVFSIKPASDFTQGNYWGIVFMETCVLLPPTNISASLKLRHSLTRWRQLHY